MDIARQAQAEAKAARVGLLWALAIGGIFALTITALFAGKPRASSVSQPERTPFNWPLTDGMSSKHAFKERSRCPRPKGRCSIWWRKRSTMLLRSSRAELLLADTSRAHFRQVLVSRAPSDDGDVEWCHQRTARLHPAETMVFPSSRAMDACPQLRGRGCSAVCVPVSISGNSVGVFHVTAADGSPPAESVQRDVEVVARRASERLAMLRAFEVSRAVGRH